MKKLSDAFATIFSDDDWFNKVLVGGFYILFVVLGIGIIIINGYIVVFMKSLLDGNKNLPYWRDFSKIIKSGWRVSLALVMYYSSVLFLLYLIHVPIFSFTTALVFFVLHTTLHPLVLLAYALSPSLRTCFNLKKIFLLLQQGTHPITILLYSAVILFVSITLGWMAIIIGWTLLIFLSLLIQNATIALSAKDYLASQS